MLRQKDIITETNSVESLKDLVDVYGQIASIRMKKIRDNVLKNRQFLEVINDIFKDTLTAYSQKMAIFKPGKFTNTAKVTFLAHNGKTVAVFISANTGFYGDIVLRVFDRFLSDIRNHPTIEVTIIGKLGRELFTGSEPKIPYTYFDFPDYGVDQNMLSDIIKHLVPYEKIKMYHGLYKSVITQIPVVTDISAGTSIENKDQENIRQYLFEPNIEEILTFFETEIFASLFEQSLRESQLSKFASRIVSMDKAEENIKEKLKELALRKLKASHIMSSKKQLNSLGAVIHL